MSETDGTTRSAAQPIPAIGARHGEQAGDAVGPYRLLEVIGEGGFGVVWLAERREPMVQRVALKIIKPGMDSEAVVGRFEQERQALAVMDHPSVAKIFDGGVTATGRPYFVMEHVQGESVTEFCDRHTYTIRQRLELFIPVCEAVQHAHHKGLIHRDLKPSNILVTIKDGQPIPKVIDFGVAKAVSHTLTDKTVYTETGQLIGTPEYMSPEQAEMGGLDVDTRTDVYSLGVVLYELLTGLLPFDSTKLRSKGYAEIQRLIREVEPPTPSKRLTTVATEVGATGTKGLRERIARTRQARLGDLARQLRRELEWIPIKALRKDRTRRYAAALSLAEDIRCYLSGRALEAAPESMPYRLRKFVDRNRVAVLAAALISVAVILGLAGTTWGLITAVRERRTAHAVQEFLLKTLRAQDPYQGGRMDISVSEAMHLAVRRLDAGELIDQPAVASSVLYAVADILSSAGIGESALHHAERALALRRDLYGDSNPWVTESLCLVGRIQHDLGRPLEAERSFRQALQIEKAGLRGFVSGDTLLAAESMTGLARALDALNRSGEAEPLLERALLVYQRHHAGDHLLVAMGLGNLGFARESLGREEDAERLYEQARQMLGRLVTGDDPNIATLLLNLGHVRQTLGRPAEAEPLFRQSLEMNQRLFKGDHPLVANATTKLAGCLAALGRLPEALIHGQQAADMAARILPEGHLTRKKCDDTLAEIRKRVQEESEQSPPPH